MIKQPFSSCVRFATRLTLLFLAGLVMRSSTLLAADIPAEPTPDTCARIIGRHLTREALPGGTNKYTLTLTISNLTHLTATPYAFAHATVLPPAGFSPTFLSPSPGPIPPGGVGTVTTCYYGFPGQLCFNLALHNADLTECCSPKLICLNLPSGFHFVIDEIRIVRSPAPHAVLRFPTQAGFRYQIEQAPTVLGPWTTAACSPRDTTLDAEGYLLGTGSAITCEVGLAPGEEKQFYRGVERP